jgi:hypothetical protein
MDGRESRVKDCLQQSKINISNKFAPLAARNIFVGLLLTIFD